MQKNSSHKLAPGADNDIKHVQSINTIVGNDILNLRIPRQQIIFDSLLHEQSRGYSERMPSQERVESSPNVGQFSVKS